MNKPNQNSECSNCNSKQKWVLHNIRHRGDIRKFCTSCVLKIHPGLFCPNCFEVYETSNLSSAVPITSSNDRVMCLKCPSVVHLDCVSKDIVNRYACPTCLNPSFDFLDSGKPPSNSGGRVIDLNKAKVYLAAATISSVSMARAAFTLRVEAEKRVKEAASARKIAKDVLENLNVVEMEEKEKKEKNVEVGGSSSVVVVAVEEGKKEKKPKASRYAAEKPKGNSAVAAAVAAQKRFQSQVSMAITEGKGKDKSRDGFGSREKEAPIQFYSPPPPVPKPLSNGNQQVQKSAATKQGKEKNGLISFAHGAKQIPGNSSEGGYVPKFDEGVQHLHGPSKKAS
ncbi:hypothetical protein MKW94_019354 [Papaver nudicaule]|uniref:Uncharacterized protein n=1 Tax=Papaver nudicaule TaxID=74823 RepID=A0AA42AYV4_PAPNU|nr:hypothetical protein [Papaver nudicaule]